MNTYKIDYNMSKFSQLLRFKNIGVNKSCSIIKFADSKKDDSPIYSVFFMSPKGIEEFIMHDLAGARKEFKRLEKLHRLKVK